MCREEGEIFFDTSLNLSDFPPAAPLKRMSIIGGECD